MARAAGCSRERNMNRSSVIEAEPPPARQSSDAYATADSDVSVGPLFRSEVVEARSRHTMGEILLGGSGWHSAWVLLSVLIAAGVVCLLAFGNYTRKERVAGQLVLSHQSIKQYAPSVGTVLERTVSEGAEIHRGDPLFRIDVNRIIAGKVDAQACAGGSTLALQASPSCAMPH
jgi:hypothetical protein